MADSQTKAPHAGLLNFRSLSGFRTREGGRVRPDHLFRAGSPRSPAMVAHLDLTLAADLRHPDERGAAALGNLPPWPCELVMIEAGTGGEAPHLALLNGKPLDAAGIDRYYLELYRNLALSPPYRALFSRFIKAAAAGSGKLLIFCAAGKDRTGILTAIVGHILGLSKDDIMADYLLSNTDESLQVGLAPVARENALRSSGQILPDDLVRKVLGVSPDYLEATFDEINNRFTGVEGYLDAIGVSASDIEAIRRRLLI